MQSDLNDTKLTDKHPPNAADRCIETKSSARRHALHHGQERRRYDDVGTPAGAGKPHCSHGAYFHREEIGAHPSCISNRDAIEEYEPDDEDEDDDRGRGHAIASELKRFRIDGDEREGDCDGEETCAHTPNGAD